VKFDGYRAQAHKAGSQVVIYIRNGHDKGIVSKLRAAPATGSAGIGARSRPLRGVKPIGSGGDYSSVVATSVADGIHEWEHKHRSAFIVGDDKRAAVQWLKSVSNALAHAIASECRRLIPYRSQIVKLDTFPVEHCRSIVSDVEKVTWHRGPPVFRTEPFKRAGSPIVRGAP